MSSSARPLEEAFRVQAALFAAWKAALPRERKRQLKTIMRAHPGWGWLDAEQELSKWNPVEGKPYREEKP